MPPSQTLSVYLPKELWEKVQEAEANPAAGFKATEFCKNQLAALLTDGALPALDPEGEAHATPSVLVERPDGSTLLVHDTAQAPPVEAYEYEIVFKDTVTSASAYLNDVVQPQGGYPISLFSDAAGRLGFLIGWPKQTG